MKKKEKKAHWLEAEQYIILKWSNGGGLNEFCSQFCSKQGN